MQYGISQDKFKTPDSHHLMTGFQSPYGSSYGQSPYAPPSPYGAPSPYGPPPLLTLHPSTTHTAHHPLPNLPTLNSPLLTPKPQSTQRRPLPTPRASPQSTPRLHHPTLRPHHQPTHRILIPSNHSNILSHSMITTASNLPMDHISPAMELHQPTTLPRHLIILPRLLTTPPRLLPTSTQHSRSTSSLPTASYLATEDTKKDMATLLGHLT